MNKFKYIYILYVIYFVPLPQVHTDRSGELGRRLRPAQLPRGVRQGDRGQELDPAGHRGGHAGQQLLGAPELYQLTIVKLRRLAQ